ncbi:MAG TPA: PAS domain S-box protein [Pyrinomonadaceae bacterium]|jgi:PAS domain S-box-containing protein
MQRNIRRLLPKAAVLNYGIGLLLLAAIMLFLWPGLSSNLLATGDGLKSFMPHAHCYLFIPQLVYLHLSSDLLIGLSYVAISLTLAYLVYRARRDIPFHWIFLAFGLFIIACGGTHFMEIYTTYHATYWLAGYVKMVTAVASVATAIVLPPLVPRALALVQSAKLSEERRHKLEDANQELEKFYKKELESQSLDLRESEERYRIVAETASDAIITIDEESRITYVNRATEKIFGYTIEEMHGRELTMLMPEYLRHLHRAGLKNYVETGHKHISWEAVELPGLHKDGQEIALELSFAEFKRGGQRFFTGIARDITLRRRTEQRQSAQYAVTRSLAESATIKEAALSILQSVCEHLGWEVGAFWIVERDMNMMRCVELWHAPSVDVEEFESLCRRITFAKGVGLPGRVWSDAAPVWIDDLAHSEIFQRRAAAIRGNLRSAFGFPVLLGGEVLGMVEFLSNEVRPPDEDLLKVMAAVGSQIGQFINRKQAESELQASEERYRSLADAMPQIVWTARPDGYLDYYNQRWFEYTGTTMEQTMGWGWQPVLHPDDVEMALRRWARAVTTGESYQIEYRFRRAADGQYRWHLGRGVPMRDGEGRIVKWFGTSTDIDDQKRAEEAAQESNRAKDNFLATLSHELRTPLTPVIGWLHMMRSGMIPTTEFDYSLAIIDKNSHTLLRIINDLIDMSAIMSGKMRIESLPVGLPSTLEEAVETVKPEADRRRIRIETVACDEEEATVLGDRVRLVQIFWNLLNNAIKFSREDSTVRVKCEVDGGELRVRFEDEGEGIRADFLPYVFERFRQADESKTREHGGLGIGLALVKSFVEAHGGRVVAESAGVNQGSHFTVYLPRFQSPVESEIAADAVAESESPAQGAHLLLVEDAEDTLTLLQTALGRRGYRTTACDSAAEALRIAATTKFDLIVSDIGLPQMDGYALLRGLREIQHLRDVPAIALTGYAAEKDAAASLKAGFDIHLAKPIEPSELIAAIERLLQ